MIEALPPDIYDDKNHGLYQAATRTIRKGKRFFRPELRTRLRVPLTRQHGNLSVNASQPIDRQTTAQLIARQTGDLATISLVSFEDSDGRPIPRIGVPAFTDSVQQIQSHQEFSGFMLTLHESGLTLLSGIIDKEPVAIDGMEAIHTQKFANACIDGIRTHLAL